MGFGDFLKKVNDIIQKARPPFPDIPLILIICSVLKRPGLSEIATTSKIIVKLAKEGFPVGDAPDGTKNMVNGLVKNIVGGIFDAIKYDSKTQVSTPIGSVQTVAFGGNAGGPVVCNGYNINMVRSGGLQN